jgi:glyoxylase-like metal-dependent hydrolase (beta-lactamase superfamily II)
MEIIPGIHQLRLPIPSPNNQMTHVNVYLIYGSDGCLLIDTGWNTRWAFNALEEQLREIGLGFGDITQIIITHMHGDHFGLSGKLRDLSNATIALHQIETALIDSRYVDLENFSVEITRWLHLNGVPEIEVHQLKVALQGEKKLVLLTYPDVTLQGGEKISFGSFNFQVLWTPGHSPGHICLYEPAKRLLLSGDHILPTIFPNVGLYPHSGDNPLGDYLNSLKAIEQLQVDLILPSHEDVFTDLKKRIQEIYNHHNERREAIIGVLEEGAKTAYEISQRIPWILNGVIMSFAELPPLDKRLAVMSALAHLELIRIEGQVGRIHRNGIMLYSVSRV